MRRLLFIAALTVLCAPAVLAAPPVLHGCQIFPDDNPWNTDISGAPVHPDSKKYIKYIMNHGGDNLHPDFGGNTNDWYGIPWIAVNGSQPLVPISFYYPDESDGTHYPIPADAPVEGGPGAGGDRHVLVLETSNCVLYEVYDAEYTGSDVTGWEAGSGAIWDLSSNDLRPEGWTSADAAGLPILPGLANCAQAEAGAIDHALRFTVSRTRRAFIYPATHYASSVTDAYAPPMGLRLRLKQNYNIGFLDGQALAIAQALKTYGMILADNGSNWFVSGEYNPDCWDDSGLNKLKQIPGTAFEVIVSPPPPSDIEGDLLLNGGFEAGLINGKKPANWKIKAHKDRRRCSTQIEIPGVGTADIARSGRCAYQFKSTPARPNDFLKQTVSFPALPAGSTLLFSGYRAAANMTPDQGKFILQLKFADGTKQKAALAFNSTSHGYSVFSHSRPAEGVVKATVKIAAKAQSGTLWVDDLSLLVAAGSLLPVPVPPAN